MLRCAILRLGCKERCSEVGMDVIDMDMRVRDAPRTILLLWIPLKRDALAMSRHKLAIGWCLHWRIVHGQRVYRAIIAAFHPSPACGSILNGCVRLC